MISPFSSLSLSPPSIFLSPSPPQKCPLLPSHHLATLCAFVCSSVNDVHHVGLPLFPLTHFSLDMIAAASIHILPFLNPVTSPGLSPCPVVRSLCLPPLIVLSLQVYKETFFLCLSANQVAQLS